MKKTQRNTSIADDHRSISTVLDVSMALLLVSASITMVFMFVATEDDETVPVTADRTAETLSEVTTTIGYTYDGITDHDPDHDHNGTLPPGSGEEFDQSTHGPILGMIGEVAVTNAEFWGEEYTRMGVDFERSLDGAVRSESTVMEHDVRVEAIWQPYEGAGIQGTVSAGRSVPQDADVSSVTLTVASGVPDASQRAAEVYDGDGEFDEVAFVLAEVLVDHYLPPAEKQRELESSSFERDLALYQYYRFSLVMNQIHEFDDWDDDDMYDPDWEVTDFPFDTDSKFLDSETTNTAWLNQYMINQTLANKIEDDLDEQFSENTTEEELAAAITTDEVKMTVRTWDTNE